MDSGYGLNASARIFSKSGLHWGHYDEYQGIPALVEVWSLKQFILELTHYDIITNIMQHRINTLLQIVSEIKMWTSSAAGNETTFHVWAGGGIFSLEPFGKPPKILLSQKAINICIMSLSGKYIYFTSKCHFGSHCATNFMSQLL